MFWRRTCLAGLRQDTHVRAVAKEAIHAFVPVSAMSLPTAAEALPGRPEADRDR